LKTKLKAEKSEKEIEKMQMKTEEHREEIQ